MDKNLAELIYKVKTYLINKYNQLNKRDLKKIKNISLIVILLLIVVGVILIKEMFSNKVNQKNNVNQNKIHKTEKNFNLIQKNQKKIEKQSFETKLEQNLLLLENDITKKISNLTNQINKKENMALEEKKRVMDQIIHLENKLELINEKLIIIARKDVKDITKDNNKEINKVIIKKQRKKIIGEYLPATTIIKAKLLNGIIAKTGVNSASDPVPFFARVQGKAIMPNNNEIDLDRCHLIMSGYGDLSMKSVIARAEKLVCIKNKKIQEIEISGVVSNNGINAIPGKISAVNGKYLINAWIGAFIGDVSNIFISSNDNIKGENIEEKLEERVNKLRK